MKKLIFLLMCLLFLLGNGSLTNDKPKVNMEMIKPFSRILVYCNTTEFIEKMAIEDYKLNLAAKGYISDKKYGDLITMNMLMNQNNKQWAIIFNSDKKNFSCIIGGNRIELYSP